MSWYRTQKISIKLTDIYNKWELNDSSEHMYYYIDSSDLDRDFTVKTLSPEEAKSLLTPINDMTVFEAYKLFTSDEQKELVKEKMRNFEWSTH